jgi:hypothetical protein
MLLGDLFEEEEKMGNLFLRKVVCVIKTSYCTQLRDYKRQVASRTGPGGLDICFVCRVECTDFE